MVLNEGQEIDYDPSTFRPFLGPLHSLILRMCMYCSPLPCFPRFPVPSLSEKWPPFPSTTIRASRRCCEEGGRARRPLGGEGERGRGAEAARSHAYIFPDELAAAAAVSVLAAACPFPLTRSSSELPNHIHGLS